MREPYCALGQLIEKILLGEARPQQEDRPWDNDTEKHHVIYL